MTRTPVAQLRADGVYHGWVRFVVNVRPPPVNNLYTNKSQGGRARTPSYKAWGLGQGLLLNTQRVKLRDMGSYVSPVDVAYLVGVGLASSRQDLGNREKAMSDLLVETGILADDSLIRSLYLRWVEAGEGDVEMAWAFVSAYTG